MSKSAGERPLVAFVTVNWRSADMVGHLLDSLESGVGFPYEAVVVNNDASESARLEKICRSNSRASLVDLGRNVGFAAGCNAGARRTTARWLVFINPDVLVKRLPVESLDELERRYGRRVLFGVTLQRNSRVLKGSFRRLPTFSRFLVDSTGLDRVFPCAAGSGMFYREEAALPRFAGVEQPTGAFFGIGRTAFDELQGFDERFFVFFEEVDLALRASRQAIPVVKLPGVVADHTGGYSTQDDRTLAIGLRWQSMRTYHAKHARAIRLPQPWIIIAAEAFRFKIQALVGRSGNFSVGRALRIARRYGVEGAGKKIT